MFAKSLLQTAVKKKLPKKKIHYCQFSNEGFVLARAGIELQQLFSRKCDKDLTLFKFSRTRFQNKYKIIKVRFLFSEKINKIENSTHALKSLKVAYNVFN